VIQEVLLEPEYGDAHWLRAYQIVRLRKYQQLPDRKQFQAVMELNKALGKAMGLTGQLTLDLMHTASGELVPIECNPQIHSAVCTLEGHKYMGAMFTDEKHALLKDDMIATSHPQTCCYWIMDPVFLRLGFCKDKNRFKLSFAEMTRGSGACTEMTRCRSWPCICRSHLSSSRSSSPAPAGLSSMFALGKSSKKVATDASTLRGVTCGGHWCVFSSLL